MNKKNFKKVIVVNLPTVDDNGWGDSQFTDGWKNIVVIDENDLLKKVKPFYKKENNAFEKYPTIDIYYLKGEYSKEQLKDILFLEKNFIARQFIEDGRVYQKDGHTFVRKLDITAIVKDELKSGVDEKVLLDVLPKLLTTFKSELSIEENIVLQRQKEVDRLKKRVKDVESTLTSLKTTKKVER